MSVYTVAALYKFAPLDDYAALREPLRAECEAAGVKGTLLLAAEGINGTIAGPAAGIGDVLAYLRRDPRLADLEAKFSAAADMPFYRLKIRLKKEIVTLGAPEVDPNEVVGTYVKPEDWNALISDPDVVLIDTRNDYEVAIGTFKGAVNPNTKSFREFPDWVAQSSALGNKPKVAMFCTGGIRCEKASAYMKAQGFDEVYHLQGGILKYLETVPADASLWEGECFVFDQRVAVGHGLAAGSYDICHACRRPVSAADKASPLYVEGVSCPHCHGALTPEKRRRFEARQHQMDLARARNDAHIGVPTEVKKRAQAEAD